MNVKGSTYFDMANVLTVSAPGKLLLMGDHAVVYDKPCLVAAIDKRIYLTLETTEELVLKINAPDVGLDDYQKEFSQLTSGQVPRQAEYIEQAVFEIAKKTPFDRGLIVTTRAPDLDSRFGFGTSAAALVATVFALNELFELNYSKKDLFSIAYRAVISLKGVGSGADIAASLYGSVLYFITAGKETRELLNVDWSLVVAYSGYKGDTPTIIKEVANRRKTNHNKINQAFDSIERFVEMGLDAMVASNRAQFGKIMVEHQKSLVDLGVSTPELDDICAVACSNGALGAKISGAGGGDCAVALTDVDTQDSVVRSLEEAGYDTMVIDIAKDGVRVEHNE